MYKLFVSFITNHTIMLQNANFIISCFCTTKIKQKYVINLLIIAKTIKTTATNFTENYENLEKYKSLWKIVNITKELANMQRGMFN